ncbi:MAG: hypothetical protein SFU85_07725 [Candidatus Methylacidiphilales bacterium]|nr:hypothetical protein [Candidatus Methylacidiphilales bacterium]
MPAEPLVASAQTLCAAVSRLRFAPPVSHVYNPLAYASGPHHEYLRRFGQPGKKIFFLGMNPGPWGMAQTGVPFGEIAAVRDWMGLTGAVGHPDPEHPKRPIQGFACEKSEVSGRRLWGLFSMRFPRAEDFFRDHFVANYCPLVFMSSSGANLTPDKLPAAETAPLFAACDRHLREAVAFMQPSVVVGVGGFAEERARLALGDTGVGFARILHPSPASPAANRDWAGAAVRQLVQAGLWPS